MIKNLDEKYVLKSKDIVEIIKNMRLTYTTKENNNFWKIQILSAISIANTFGTVDELNSLLKCFSSDATKLIVFNKKLEDTSVMPSQMHQCLRMFNSDSFRLKALGSLINYDRRCTSMTDMIIVEEIKDVVVSYFGQESKACALTLVSEHTSAQNFVNYVRSCAIILVPLH
jgi:hypothetical protein